jgi:hypothetical protein
MGEVIDQEQRRKIGVNADCYPYTATKFPASQTESQDFHSVVVVFVLCMVTAAGWGSIFLRGFPSFLHLWANFVRLVPREDDATS